MASSKIEGITDEEYLDARRALRALRFFTVAICEEFDVEPEETEVVVKARPSGRVLERQSLHQLLERCGAILEGDA